MGKYINQNSKGNPLPNRGKIDVLLQDGAKIILPFNFQNNMICVFDNGVVEAAAYLHNEEKFKEFVILRDTLPKTFLSYPHAKQLAE